MLLPYSYSTQLNIGYKMGHFICQMLTCTCVSIHVSCFNFGVFGTCI